MKAACLLQVFTIALFWAVLGCSKKEPNISQPDKWMLAAPSAVESKCAKIITGFHRFVGLEIPDRMKSDDPEQWHGLATVEFINHVGGIDRTNIPFRFVVVPDKSKTLAAWFDHYPFDIAEMIDKYRRDIALFGDGDGHWSNEIVKARQQIADRLKPISVEDVFGKNPP
jgi:hypothetical protein